ncbi:MAG: DNA-binding protein [Methanosarcinaceae archaeon]|nr:DNA-binding protein [Methanosarcinaceae archaeon]
MAYEREVSVRIFAKELRNSKVLYKDGDDQYAPQYLLTPTGAKINRVFITGTLTETENIGTETEYQRGRISDPTGVFLVYAGQYQPEVCRFLADAKVPSIVSVIGKISSFETNDGNVIVSIRPEHMQYIDPETRDMWIYETAKQTYERILTLETDDETIQNVKNHYDVNTNDYKKMVLDALEL